MGKILVVAEKPSVARDYARVLKCKTRKDGYIEGDTHIISWALGHLVTLAEPHHYDPKYKTWRMNELPIRPAEVKLRVIRKTSKQFNVLKDLMKRDDIDEVICGTDSGREGELIFRYVYDHAKCKKPTKRLWISSMTDEAITQGFAKIKPGTDYDHLYYSAKCRSEADWLVGMNASRAFSLKYKALLTIGRVQTPTLAIIVNRHLEIENFKPETYYEVVANLGEFEATWINKAKKSKIKTMEQATKIMEKIHQGEAVVDQVKSTEKKTPAPLLYDLTELQRDANKKYGYTAKKTLSIAQSLYEKHKMVTYPRTDSRYLTADMKGTVKNTLKKLQIERYHQIIKDMPEVKFTKRIINDAKVTDHHAIIPTESNPRINALSEDELHIYDLIVSRLVEAFYPPYKELQTEVILDINEEQFIAKGKSIRDMGWKKVRQSLLGEKNKGDKFLPLMEKEDTFPVKDEKMNEKQTKPPKPYNEATLLSAMEHPGKFVEDQSIKEHLKEMGLGTPATRAAIIERLITVGYIMRSGKTLIPTDKGISIISVVPDEIKTPEMTGKWERALYRIAEGSMEPNKFMASIGRYVDFLVNHAITTRTNVVIKDDNRKKKPGKKKPSFGKCPICGEGDVNENKKAYYCSRWQEDCKLTIWKNHLEPYGVALTPELMKEILVKKTLEGVPVVLPQTAERCTAQLVLNEKGLLQLLNIKRIE